MILSAYGILKLPGGKSILEKENKLSIVINIAQLTNNKVYAYFLSTNQCLVIFSTHKIISLGGFTHFNFDHPTITIWV